MASAPLLVTEAANIFVDNRDKSLIIRDLVLPRLEEIKVAHVPGGAVGEIELSLGVRHLEVAFSLAGRDPLSLEYFGASQIAGGFGNTFTIYEALRSKADSTLQRAVAVVTGRLSAVSFDPFRRGIVAGSAYMITEITSYRLAINGVLIYDYNWLLGSFMVNGVEQNAVNAVIQS